MKKRIGALLGVIAVLAASFSFAGTPKASAMLADPGGGGCYYTYGWIVVNGTWIPVLIQHC